MSYEQALEAAGVEVIEYVEFGSYQGDWLCLIRDNGVPVSYTHLTLPTICSV